MSLYWIIASVTFVGYSAVTSAALHRAWPPHIAGRAWACHVLGLVIGAACGVAWPLTIIPLIQQAGRP